MAPRHRIAWKSRLTDYSDHGDWYDATVDLSDTVATMNRRWPELHHWIETEPSWAEVDTSTEDTEIIQ